MQSDQTRLFVVDDDATISAVLERLAEYGYVICGFARTQVQAIRRLRTNRPDLVLVEIALETSSDLPLITSIREEFPELAVVAFSDLPEAVYAERALRSGALAYVPKTSPFDHILMALRAAKNGEACFSPGITRRMMTNMVRSRRVGALRKLTAREMSVFELIGEGRDLTAIASELGISRKTVEIYRRRIKDKFQMESVSELHDYARKWRRREATPLRQVLIGG